MDEADQLSSLISDIYDAALDSSRWIDVLESCAQFLNAFAVTLQDRAHPDAIFERHFGLDPYYQKIFFEKFSNSDPRNALAPFCKAGQVFSTFAVMPRAEFYDTPLYQEYIQPQRISDNVRCVFEKSPSSFFGLFRRDDDGPSETTFRRTRLLMPHVRRAMLIAKSTARGKAVSATFIDTLDGLRAGIFLLDAKLRIVHANRSGYDMLAQNLLLCNAGGRLAIKQHEANRMLDRSVATAANGDSLSGKGFSVFLEAGDGDHYIAHLLPLTSGERHCTRALYQAVAALFVYRTEPELTTSTEIIAKHYSLTPMEVSVLLAVAGIGGVPEVARTLGIAQSTVKTHLLHVFAKTGTRRQAELVKLVAGLSNPLLR
jgi:DNA-binding CsgD family transcriptional regulator/PAS domain-containing protein